MEELLKRIDALFSKKKSKYSIHAFSIVRWQNGLWSFDITDDWHKWHKKNLPTSFGLYKTPQDACIAFLNFVRAAKINVKKLQY